MGTGQARSVNTPDAQEQHYDRLKLLFLSVAFFCVIGSYTVIKELKNTIFPRLVGVAYIPHARVWAMVMLIPLILVYSKLVDRLRRYHLLCLYSGVFAIGGLIFAYYLGDPVIGIPNTNAGSNRWFGWLFYLFVECYSPFVVSVFWAFANSITTPAGARRNYGWMVSWSKMGGIVSILLSFVLLRYITGNAAMSAASMDVDLLGHQLLLAGASVLLLMVWPIIYLMMKKIPRHYLHGYEAAYQVEREKRRRHDGPVGVIATVKSMFDGLRMLIIYPYVLGIFAMSFFYEVIATVLSFLTVSAAHTQGGSMSEVLAYLLLMCLWMHVVGFIISFFGTTALVQFLGTRRCLLLIPAFSGLALVYLMTSSSMALALQIAYVLIRSINYAFSWPLRESLYIPTVKEIKFKSKSWIDAFGGKFARTTGSGFNFFVAQQLAAGEGMPIYGLFFSLIIGAWFVAAYLLGIRHEVAVARNEVIGADLDEEASEEHA